MYIFRAELNMVQPPMLGVYYTHVSAKREGEKRKLGD